MAKEEAGSVWVKLWHFNSIDNPKMIHFHNCIHPSISLTTLPKLCAATLRICADGGANRLYEREQQGATACHPHVIIGDLDSIRPEVAAHYRDRGTQVLDLSHDQDSTDLQKCVDYIETHLGGEDGTEGGVDHIIAFGTCPMEFVCASVHDLAAGKTQGTGLRKGSVCGAAVWE